jgi:hypothetical protein
MRPPEPSLIKLDCQPVIFKRMDWSFHRAENFFTPVLIRMCMKYINGTLQQDRSQTLRRAAVRATLAPSVHNTQPWQFGLGADRVEGETSGLVRRGAGFLSGRRLRENPAGGREERRASHVLHIEHLGRRSRVSGI